MLYVYFGLELILLAHVLRRRGSVSIHFFYLFIVFYIIVIGFRSGYGDYGSYVQLFQTAEFPKSFFAEQEKLFYGLIFALRGMGFGPLVLFLLMAATSLSLEANNIKKYSQFVYLSLFIYSIQYLIFFDGHLMRQGIALSIVQFSYRFCIRRQPGRFLLAVVIASLFHYTAWLFLIGYLFAEVKLTKGLVVWFVVLCALILVTNPFKLVMDFLQGLSPTKYLGYFGAPSLATGWFSFVEKGLVCFICISYRRRLNGDRFSSFLVVNYFLSVLVFCCFLGSDVFASRISVYFRVSEIYLIPVLYKEAKSSNKSVALVIYVAWMLLKQLLTVTFLSDYVFAPFSTAFSIGID